MFLINWLVVFLIVFFLAYRKLSLVCDSVHVNDLKRLHTAFFISSTQKSLFYYDSNSLIKNTSIFKACLTVEGHFSCVNPMQHSFITKTQKSKSGIVYTIFQAFDKNNNVLLRANVLYYLKQLTSTNDSEFPRLAQPHYHYYSSIHETQYLYFTLIHHDDHSANVNSTEIQIEIVGSSQYRVSISTLEISSQNIEPGSYFFIFKPIRNTNHTGYTAYANIITSVVDSTFSQVGYSSSTYLEFVSSPNFMRNERIYSSSWKTYYNDSNLFQEDRPSGAAEQLNSKYPDKTSSALSAVHICVVAKNVMDGQRKIWLNQLQHLNSSLQNFKFTFYLMGGLDASTTMTFYYHLKLLNASVLTYPLDVYEVLVEDLSEDPEDGTLPASQIWGGSKENLNLYISERFRLNNYSTINLRPTFVKKLLEFYQNNILNQDCDIISFGSSYGKSSDVITQDTAFSLGIPTVVELNNLFPDERLLPTVYVAPSLYTAEHHSITKITHINISNPVGIERSNAPLAPNVIIIPPSVDFQNFNKNQIIPSYHSSKHKSCEVINNYNKKSNITMKNRNRLECFHIGFIGRLSKEKNPGLFVQFAAFLIHDYYPYIKFTIIGDGPLREHLEDLVKRLDLEWAVSFLGWVHDGLSSALASFDILINPSMAASETFCIANIEAMSLGVPLVTFSLGGVGEYVDEFLLQLETTDDTNLKLETEYHSIRSNAMVLYYANPEFMAKSVFVFIKYPNIRSRIGYNGQNTIKKYFTIDRQMHQYRNLYLNLMKQ